VQLKSSAERYGAIAQLFHWTTLVLIVTQFILAYQAEHTESLLQKAKTLTTHKSVGMTVFMLVILRLLWRMTNPAPTPLVTEQPWQRRLADCMHWALYSLILLTPVVGLLMSSAKNYPVSWFGLFTWPNFVQPNEPLFDFLKAAHGILATTIFCLAVLHIIAALKHHFYDKDNVLRRMLPLKLR